MADPVGEQERCPTCGQAVELHTGSGGTSSYVKAAEEERDAFKLEVETLNRWLEEERGPWVEEVKSQMVPALRSLEAERDSLRSQLVEAREALEILAKIVESEFPPDCSLVEIVATWTSAKPSPPVVELLARLSSTESG